MKLIEKTKDLKSFCKELSTQKFITVDLEFLREKTYYAKLCLIQVAYKGDSAIIDPLAEDIDLTPFFEVLDNKRVLKIFHSSRQDIEIIYNLTGKIPSPLFDTQIAAMVCGFGESVGYESLVKKILKTDLDKTYRLSNWSKRPLDDTQLEYALSDVTHLVNVYEYMRDYLEKNNRIHWLDEEMEHLMDPETYITNPEEAWQKIKHRSHNPKYLTMLRELAAWRERRAQRKNVLRQSVIKDEALLNIAAVAPETHEELEEIRNMRKDILSGKIADEIIETVKKAKEISPENYVKLKNEKTNPAFSFALYELLKLLLKIISQEKGVVAKLIASDEDIKEFSSANDDETSILKGWRYEIFGKEALKLREGKIDISYNPKKKNINMKEASV
ncbi:MAG: ribonuclease D [Lactobacillaceae bacterium]|jgi:ribonuclease D|nr:ribonuclease D [Lactobacillaceae bacterium]